MSLDVSQDCPEWGGSRLDRRSRSKKGSEIDPGESVYDLSRLPPHTGYCISVDPHLSSRLDAFVVRNPLKLVKLQRIFQL